MTLPSILFVCMGNICRSPTAEIIWKSVAQEAFENETIRCDSAGTIGYHVGEPPDSRMQQALREHGYQPFGQSRKVSETDFERFDIILAMDKENLRSLEKLNIPEALRGKLHLFCDYGEIPGVKEVPDPYYGGKAGFDRVIEIVETGCRNIVQKLESNS